MVALYDDAPVGAARFADLARGLQGVGFRRTKFDAINQARHCLGHLLTWSETHELLALTAVEMRLPWVWGLRHTARPPCKLLEAENQGATHDDQWAVFLLRALRHAGVQEVRVLSCCRKPLRWIMKALQIPLPCTALAGRTRDAGT